jgi:predicted nucleic acid-binding Zn ribbon protein
VSSGDDTLHHDNNKKLIAHPTYAAKLFEKTLTALAIEAKGEPWYINSGTNIHVTGSAKALNHVNNLFIYQFQ